MQSIQKNVLGCIGKTPLVALDRLTEGLDGRIFAKLEYVSPGLSKKDRIALEMIEAAEREGRLAPGQPVIELTSGNMGTGLSIVCRQKGYPFIAVMSRGNSVERAKMMRAFGAEVVLVDQHPDSVPGKVTGRDLELVEIRTQVLTQERGAFRIDQFNNPASVETGALRIVPEVIEQLQGMELHAFVDFMGTGGSFVGIAKGLKEHFPNIQCYGLEPENAPFYGRGPDGSGRHAIQGGGYNFTLSFVEGHRDAIDGFLTVSDEDAVTAVRGLALDEGLFAGFSSGANTAAALRLLKERHQGQNILITLPDSGTKYLSTDLWNL